MSSTSPRTSLARPAADVPGGEVLWLGSRAPADFADDLPAPTRTVEGDPESLELNAADSDRFTTVVLATPLEDLRDAAALLARLRPLVTRHGQLIATATNATHVERRLAALRGEGARGLTQAAIATMLEGAGWVGVRWTPRIEPAQLEPADVPPAVLSWLRSAAEADTRRWVVHAEVADDGARLKAAMAELAALRPLRERAAGQDRRIAELERELASLRRQEAGLRDLLVDRHEELARLEAATVAPTAAIGTEQLDALRAELDNAYHHIRWMENTRLWRTGQRFWKLKTLLKLGR